MKVRIGNLNDQQRIETLDALYTAAGSIHGRDAMKLFLRDLLTESERVMLGRRIMIAHKLISGVSAPTIVQELKVGKDTVYRVQRWLEDQFPGYEEAIKNLEKEFENRKSKKEYATSAMARLKKKYPGHFLFFRS